MYANTQRQSPSDFFLRVSGNKTSWEKLNLKSLYQSFASKISCKPTAMKKYDKVFNTDTFHLDWEKIYLLPSKVTLHARLREFQYKILNRSLYTNDVLFKIKKLFPCGVIFVLRSSRLWNISFFIAQKCVLSLMKAQLC